MKTIRTLMMLASLILAAQSTHALLISGNSVFTTGQEDVTATFVGFSSDFTDNAYFDNNGSPQFLFQNKTSLIGASQLLGTFADSTELAFYIFVTNRNHNYYSGSATNNFDSAIHVQFTDMGNNTIRVGFEDWINGGDFDYNDLMFDIVGIPSDEPVVPEPATLGLIGTGLTALLALRRRKAAELA